jgi:vancomycin resistance protein YoaR
MVPDGRKLQRKRTTATHSNSISANAPIPMHVPLSEMPAPNRTTDLLKQDQLNLQGQDTKGKEKIRRLSKRRSDI